jgi:hypothetical protein
MNIHISEATKNEFGEIFLLQIIEWVRDNFSVEDVYDFDTLYQWALDNGFVDEE